MALKILTNAQETTLMSTQIKEAQLYISSKYALHPQDKSHSAEVLFLPPSKPWKTEGI